MLTFLCYTRCITCIKAKKWLDENGIEYTFRDIKIDNPSVDEIKKWHKESGLDIKKFFNTSGNLYKSMNLKEKLETMTDQEKYELLASDGLLVKRPLLVSEEFVVTGFKQQDWEKLLK